MTTQRKLVEVFKLFMEKSVIPSNDQNQMLINEWKHLNNVLSADPVDPNQLDFFLYMLNKQQAGSSSNTGFNQKIPLQRQTTSNITDLNKFNKKSNDFSNFGTQSQKKNSMLGSSGLGSKRKNLLSNLQNFQNLLIRNQQKLENYNRSSLANNTNKQTSFSSSTTYKKNY